MMTRFLKLIPFLLGGSLLAALCGCSPHEFPEEGSGEYSVRLVFDEDLPLLTTIHPGTKAATDAVQTRYTVQLFPYRGEMVFSLVPEYTYSFTRDELEDLETTLTLPMTGARYRVAVWTDWTDGDGMASWDPSAFEKIVLSGDYRTGERQRDAFFGTADAELSREGLKEPVTIEMHRPVAQLRFLLPNALTFLTDRGIDANTLRASLAYTSPLNDNFDLLLGQSSGALEGVSMSVVPWIDPSSGALAFCSDFLLVNDAQTSVSVDFSLKDASGEVLFSYQGEVPLLRAHRTDVSFGYSSDTDQPGGIGINPGFETEIEIKI